MSNVDFLRLKPDLERVEEALTERLARIAAGAIASESADDATVAAVERMLAAPHARPFGCTRISYGRGEIGSVWVPVDNCRARSRYWDEDIEDDFAGGTAGIDGSPWLMPWRSHLAELISRLREEGYARHAAHLARLADVNSLKKPFTKADEAEVIKSIREYLGTFRREQGGDGADPTGKPSEAADGMGWPEARDNAEEIRLDGKRFTSYRKMAKAIGTPDGAGQDEKPAPGPQRKTPKATKRSTAKGEAQVKIIAALTLHHKHQDGGCLNLGPIGVNELARKAEVAQSSVSDFFDRKFNEGEKGGHAKYKIACNSPTRLVAAIKLLNGEYSPSLLFGSNPPGEGTEDEE